MGTHRGLRSLTGIWGELLTVRQLRRSGWTVDWDGGFTQNRDLTATKGSRPKITMQVQVKTTRRENGLIAFRGSGDEDLAKLDQWVKRAADDGALAVFAFCYIIEAPDPSVPDDPAATAITIPIPTKFKIHAVSAASFRIDVDTARDTYAAQPYKRRHRQNNPGDMRSREGLQYPVCYNGAYDAKGGWLAYPTLAQFAQFPKRDW